MPSPQDSVNLSVILITRNESRHVLACLQSVAFADEWIVVDWGSSDDTCEIAAAFGAQVSRTADWPGFGAQKNRALALARGRWVLSIDADERVGPALALSIQAVVARPLGTAAGFELARLSSFCGRWMRHGDWYPDRVLRLFRRDAGRFSDDLVHERLLVQGPVARLEGDLLHHTMPSLDDALAKMNRYSTGRAQDMRRQGRRGSLAGAIGHAMWTFVRGYVLRRGFLDGRLGFVLALYAAEGTYYRYLKLWLLAHEPAPLSAE